MDPSYSTKADLPNEDQQTLLRIAQESIQQGIKTGQPLQPNLQDYSAPFQEMRATFVTLHLKEKLRGCIGIIEAIRPLIIDVAANAYAAASRDPRFSPVQQEELDRLVISISILSPRESIEFSSEEDLIQKIRPGIDGLILRDKGQQGTFLPAVWKECPDPKEFLSHLKMKAGLPPLHWSETVTIERFTVESID